MMANGKQDTKNGATDLSEVAALCAGDEAFVKYVLYPSDDFTSFTQGLLDADSTHTPAEITTRVQARLADLEREVYLLKSHRNAVASDIPLPAELLARVFCALEQSYRGSVWKALQWVCVTQVCRHWRYVALECPALWCYITTQNRTRNSIGVLLERSKQAPLTVCFRNWNAENDGTLLDIVSQTQRLQSLELERSANHKSSHIEKVLSRFSDSPKLLENLVIVGQKPNGSMHGSMLGMTMDAIPKELAQMDFPCLHTLEISRCLIPWEVMPKAHQLTHLKLHTLPRKESMPTQSFISSLQSLTQLQSLDVSGMLPDEGLPAGLSPISLPTLRTLKLKGSSTQLIWFLRATRIQPQATPHFAFTPDPSAEDAVRFLSALDDCWVHTPKGTTKVQKPTIRAKFSTFGISNVGEDDDTYGKEVKPPTLYWWFGPALPARAKARPNVDKAKLSISFTKQERSSYQALRAFLDQLDFGSLRCLQIDSCPSLDASMWDGFARLEKLTTIIFRNGKTMHGFAEKIKNDPVDGPGSDRDLSESSSDSDDGYSYKKKKEPKKKEIVKKPYFPGLKYVRCYKVHFGQLSDWGGTAEVVSDVVAGFGRRPDPKYSYLTMEVVDCVNFSHEDDDYMAESTDVNVDYDGKYSVDDPDRRRRRDFW